MSGGERRHDLDERLGETGAGDAERIAQEQFVHGLLETRERDGATSRERRVGAVLAAMGAPAVVVSHRWRLRPMRVLSGLAAVLALAALVVLGMPNTRTAAAVVQASIAASSTAGDRRYEMHAEVPDAPADRPAPKAMIDLRDADHMLIRATSPFGDEVTIGRNSGGAWVIRPDGTLDRYPPRQAWPRWVNFGSNTVLLASVDELLGWLQQKYKLTRPDNARAPSGQGPECERVTAVRRPGPGPEPDRVELWIDPSSHIVRRMELHWNEDRRPRGPGPAGRPPQGGPGDGDDMRPPPPPEEGGPPPPPEGDEGGPPPGRDGPPPGGRDGPPDDERPIHRRPPPPPPRDRPPHPCPEFLGGPPDFAGGHQPPPPRTLVFELAEGASFADGWFDPETHQHR